MATTYKVLGQSNPAAATDTTLYTVPSATETVVSTITVANLGTSGLFRIAVRPAGATIANQHYIAYDVPLNANDTIFCSDGDGSVNVIQSEGRCHGVTLPEVLIGFPWLSATGALLARRTVIRQFHFQMPEM